MKLQELLAGTKRAAIFGHVRPDGDCVGSTLGLYNYMKENFPKIDTDIYLEEFAHSFRFLKNSDQVRPRYEEGTHYDTCIVMDCGDANRVGANGASCMAQAEKTICMDHHISNKGFAQTDLIFPAASSTCEVLYERLEDEKISKATAECLYLGIAHDTGVFKFSCTGKRTLQIASGLIEKGVDFPRIINETYLSRTFAQTRVTGKVMMDCRLALDGRVVYGYLTKEDMDAYGVGTVEMDGIIDCLREVEGTEVAIFLYQNRDGAYKVSMRSQYFVDVSRITGAYGGGGHKRAAGCTVTGDPEKIVQELVEQVREQLA